MEKLGAASSRSENARCKTCGCRLDLRCEDCGCPVSCHDFIYAEEGKRLAYCRWDFGPCPKDQRPAFLAAVEERLGEVREMKRP